MIEWYSTVDSIPAETGISKRDFENMIDFEKNMFDKVVKGMEDSEKVISEFLSGKKTEEVKNRMVIFISDTDSFMDMTGEALGPFKKGDLANLPVEIAKILQESGKIEVVDEGL